jgi:OmcA/MtrC family decaheme c-type cytochrome
MTLEKRQVSVGVPASSGENRRRKVNSSLIRWGTATLMALAMAGCGGGGGGGGEVAAPSVSAALSAAAAVPANDTAINSSASFTVVQDAGVPAVTVNSPPKINFAVFSDGKVKSDLAITNVSFALAKLIPGTGGNPDQWVSYVSRTESTAKAPNNVGSGAAGAAALATAVQATTDGKMTAAELTAAGLSAQLVYNPDGYYTYVFRTDIKNPAWKAPDSSTFTNGVVFEPNRTHRIAIQLSYKNAAGETILVNPYFDFTIGADGKSVTVTDPSKTRKMTDVSSCNGCHDKLALHGGGRVDTQYCVMCHNPGTTDANSGNVLTMATMVHKIHSGKLLYSQTLAGSTLTPKVDKGGEEYVIWGYNATKVDFAEVGFPQDLRNCAKCHSATNPATPQGDNWKTVVSKEACLTCHANNAGSDWDTSHVVFAQSAQVTGTANPAAKAKDLTNAQCAACHKAGSGITSDRVHWNQNEENGANYKMNIESASYDATTRKVTFKYFLSNPTNGNAAYNLTASDNGYPCASATSCSTSTKFGNLRFYLAYPNMVGQSTVVTDFTSYNNGGSAANVYAYLGTNDGSNHYTATITVPNDVAGIAVAFGTARLISIGQIKETKLQAKSASDPRPPVAPIAPSTISPTINTVVQNTYMDVVLTGSLNPRRVVVASEKCNVCHGALGTTSGSNTLAEAFHGGARDTVEACAVCHDANRASSTVMTNGLVYNESYQFKRMIHGIHGNSKRLYPFTHGNAAVGAFCNPANPLSKSPLCDPALVLATTGVENYAAEVAYPQVGINCDACHVNKSYQKDSSPLGATLIAVPGNVTSATASTTFSVTATKFESSGACVGLTGSVAAKNLKCTSVDLSKIPVISPKAASCTACHDSSTAIGHVTSFGGSAFGDKSQAQIAGLPRETCDDCHSPGGFKGVDIVHGQK